MSEQRRVLRYEIAVNDQPQPIAAGRVLMAQPHRQAQRSPAGRVEVWVDAALPVDWPASSPAMRLVQAFGTGQPIPDGAVWLASCLDGPLVRHVYEVTPDA